MSTGLFRIVDAVNAIGAAALNTAADLGVAVSAAQAAGTALASAGGLSGGAGGGGMGATSGAGGSSNTTGGLTTTMVPTWGATTVLTPEQAIAALRLLQNRINPLWGQMGGR
jgi:hypothetical protein